MKHEHHITVAGDPLMWRGWCAAAGIKSLWIELNTFERQLMCAITGSDLERECCTIEAYIKDIGKSFAIERIKHEVQPELIDISTHCKEAYLSVPRVIDGAVYYECHVKLDGPFLPHVAGSSRDLFRDSRWYVTRRQPEPFNPEVFAHTVTKRVNTDTQWRGASRVHSFEYEACVRDTNPKLDQHWMYAL